MWKNGHGSLRVFGCGNDRSGGSILIHSDASFTACFYVKANSFFSKKTQLLFQK